jgi:hypothetical protein
MWQAPYNKQLQRTVQTASRRTACASFHYAHAVRVMRQRAAAELRRYAAMRAIGLFALLSLSSLVCFEANGQAQAVLDKLVALRLEIIAAAENGATSVHRDPAVAGDVNVLIGVSREQIVKTLGIDRRLWDYCPKNESTCEWGFYVLLGLNPLGGGDILEITFDASGRASKVRLTGTQ